MARAGVLLLILAVVLWFAGGLAFVSEWFAVLFPLAILLGMIGAILIFAGVLNDRQKEKKEEEEDDAYRKY